MENVVKTDREYDFINQKEFLITGVITGLFYLPLYKSLS